MFNTQFINRMTEKLGQVIPPDLKDFQQDLSRNMQAVLRSTLAQCNLVTREEFDRQKEVLIKTRQKLSELEAQVRELEQNFE